MNADTACALVKGLCTKPGWKLTSSVSNRFEDAIVLRVDYPAPLFNRDKAPDYTDMLDANASFTIRVGGLKDLHELCRCILEILVFKIELHEHREALRVAETWHAPFHPHRHDGMNRWGDPEGDLHFGVA